MDNTLSGRDVAVNHQSKLSVSGLFQEMRKAATRAIDLRAHALDTTDAMPDAFALEVFQELDAAHEELRVAEEHLTSQADAIAQGRMALEVERNRYRDLFDSAPDPYVLTDANGVVLEANRRACQLFNIDVTLLTGKPLSVFVGPQDRRYFRDVIELLLRDPGVSKFGFRIAPRQARSDVPLEVSACRAVGPDGKPSALRWLLRPLTDVAVGAVGDFTREHALGERLRERTDELQAVRHLLEHSLAREQATRLRAEAQLQTQQGLLAAVAHELRSPLSSIAGWLQLMREDGPQRDERGFVSMIRSVRTLTRLVEDLVDHTRCEAGFLTLERAQVDVTTLLAQVVEELRPTAVAKHIELISDVPAGPCEVNADGQRVRQVLTNLLSNALKFSRADSKVYLSMHRDAEQVSVVVRDTGAGINPEFLPHVFEPFAQHVHVGTAPRAGGLGLGMRISRWIIELHGGSLTASSPGRGLGACFTVRLPIEMRAGRAKAFAV